MIFEYAVSNGEGTLLHYGVWRGTDWPEPEWFAGAFGPDLIIMRNASDDLEPCTTGE